MSTDTAIPRSPDDITAEWLSAALTGDAPDPVRVDSVEVRPLGAGLTGSAYSVRARYAANPGGVPDHLVVKLASENHAIRERVSLGYRSEIAFYADVLDRVEIPTPACFHRSISDDGQTFALVLAHMDGHEQSDQIDGCTNEQAVHAVRALAALHGPLWCDPSLTSFTSTAMPLADEQTAYGLGEVTVMAAGITVDRLGDVLGPAHTEVLRRSAAAVGPWLLSRPERFALLHSDYRSDNLLFHAESSEVTVIDWQTLAVGLPARDLAYFLATSLVSEQRDALDRRLVEEYHRVLVDEYGITGYDVETCWEDYRLGLLQAVLVPTLGYAFADRTDRADAIMSTMLIRACEAIARHDALGLIDARP
ncbi:phosphotransferase family protein [Gordonia caeni]|uniref:Phosphotransferase n=1 Tax=Gordonia caeni TaxID=1007097 RepID=A0ABP7P1G9_9ACTN